MTPNGDNPGDVADVLELLVPVGGRVMVVSDLQLGGAPSAAETAQAAELAASVAAATGPGVIVLAGNLLASGQDARSALSAHPKLTRELAAYAAGPGRRVVALPGDRDSQLAWSGPARQALATLIGAETALSVELRVLTGAGERKVRVQAGRELDPLSRPEDARDPVDSPFAHHIRSEVLPALQARSSGAWLAGIEHLDDAGAVSRFIASRLVYRRLIRFGWLLAVPVLVAILLRLPATALRSARHGGLTTRLGVLVIASVAELLLLIAVAVLAARSTSRALAAVSLAEPLGDANEPARSSARQLVTEGWSGLVTGHTCRPELAHLGPGFYANCGAVCEVVSEHPNRLPGVGLPSVFLAHRLLSWIELEAGNELHVRLMHSRQDLPGATFVERFLARRPSPPSSDPRPAVVATYPQGSGWPVAPSPQTRDRRVRRLAAAGLVVVGFVSLVSAMSDPLRDRIDVLHSLYPTAVPQTASAVAALVGVALIVLARSIRRGQRRAWVVCEALLLAVAVAHVVKGIDVEESLLALLAAALLWVYRDSFSARADVAALRRGLLNVLSAAVLTVLAGTLAVEISTAIDHTRHHAFPRISWVHALEASLNRMVGSGGVALPKRIDLFLDPAMATAAVALALAFLAVVFRPVVARRAAAHTAPPGKSPTPDIPTGADPDRFARARAVVARHGSGTLDYFALRPDKDFFFWGDTVVAHAVYGGVCLVSPDPIGPVAEREEAWRAFRRYVDEHGWALGGLGAGEDWLPVYRATGMHDLYVGDEAVVRVGRFSLEGGRFKGLRQAVNRIAKYGYTISFHDPARIDAELRSQLEEVMTKSRRGDVERGFSMTLGRVFDPDDHGLLLAVVHGPPGDGSGQPGKPGGQPGSQVGGGEPGGQPGSGVGGGGTPGSGEAGRGKPGGGTPGDQPGSGKGGGGTPGGQHGSGKPGPPVAFCHYVPAPGIGGYSLDLMRRDAGDHPNGLIDFAVVETIKHLRAHGHEGLGLNFATMRAVLAGEAGEGLTQRVQSWVLRRMGDSMQIESLWKFNAKFDPDWQPRYAVYDAPENMLAVAIAVARAESFWELPVIGRFLVPSQ